MPPLPRWLRTTIVDRLLAAPCALLAACLRQAPRSGREPLWVEPLEDRTLMSASILGTVFDAVAPPHPGVPGIVAFLDENNNGVLDQRSLTFANTTPNNFAPIPATLAGVAAVSPIQVSGVAVRPADINVFVDASRDGSGPTGSIEFALLSPAGVIYAAGPTLFKLTPNSSFQGTLDDQATTAANLNPIASGTNLSGTFKPVQPFTQADRLITVANPNGTWYLLIVESTQGVTLHSWSLTFPAPEISTITDTDGNYTFEGLPEGQHQVAIVAPNAPPPVVVNAGPNQVIAGVNFGITPPPDLTGVSFTIQTPTNVNWGSPVVVFYTITNRGTANAGAFAVDLVLSPDSLIDSADLLQDSEEITGLAAGASHSGQFVLTLPDAPPTAAFSVIDLAYLGLRIDSANEVAEANETNNGNQGEGIDLGVLVQRPNQAITTDTSAQQQPSLAVDPANPLHLVLAYMDYGLQTNGYAGISVRTSSDGGLTWSTPTPVPLPQFQDVDGMVRDAAAAGYAKVVFDLNGNVFISYMAATFHGPKPPLIFPDGTRDGTGSGDPLFRSYGLQASNGIFVVKSTNGGASWSAPITVTSNSHTPGGAKVNFFDVIPDIAVDTSPTSANKNNIYITWTRIYKSGAMPGVTAGNGGTDIMVARSTNGGASFTTLNQANGTPVIAVNRSAAFDEGGGNNNFSRVAVDIAGLVAISYSTGGQFAVSRSTNAGTSFLAAVTAFIGTPAGSTGQVNAVFPETELYPGYPPHNFPQRGIVTDPTNVNTVFTYEAIKVNQGLATTANLIDRGDIYFSFSLNRGGAYRRVFQVDDNSWNLEELPLTSYRDYMVALNDDDATRFLRHDGTLQDEVVATQTQPRLAVDAQGRLIMIWLDSRRDPANQQFDVFGSVSTDHGFTWSANFRITDVSFDPENGKFTDARGFLNAFMGDSLALTTAGGLVYAAWTDTRNGNQDIYFARFPIVPAPPPDNDRFEDNNTPATATDLGQISSQQVFNRLQVAGGDEDWYQITPLANRVLASITGDGAANLQFDLFDPTGTTLLASSAEVLGPTGERLGRQILFATQSGQPLLLRVRGVALGEQPSDYVLNVNSLTDDLGTRVYVPLETTLEAGSRQAYALTAALAGSLEFALRPDSATTGTLTLQILSSDGRTVLGQAQAAAGGIARVGVPVNANQPVLVVIQGASPTAAGHFFLEVVNLDPFETSFQDSLFFATGGTPSDLGLADFNDDDFLDIVTASTDLTNAIGLLRGNGTGLFWAPQTFNAGPGSAASGVRGLVIDEFLTGDSQPGVAVSNFEGADVSVLPGRGDGTLGSERRSDAVARDDALASADLNEDGIRDLIVLERTPPPGGVVRLAYLQGRGDGTFLPPQLIPTTFTSGGPIVLTARVNNDDHDDILVFGSNSSTIELYLGNGDGTLQERQFITSAEAMTSAVAVDADGDGQIDIVAGGQNNGRVYFLKGHGDGTFDPALGFTASTAVNRAATRISGLVVIDAGGVGGFGTAPDGVKDILTVTVPLLGGESPHINFLPGLGGGAFGAAQRIRAGSFTGPIAAGDVSGDGRADIVVAEPGGVRVIYSQRPQVTPNTTQQTATNFGVVVHYVSPERAIVPPVSDTPDASAAWFKMTVPTEVVAGAGDQVIDFSALFAHQEGAGLQMEVLDAQGNILGTGPRFRVQAAQGTVLFIHILGLTEAEVRSAGTYTLVIDVLPQVVTVAAQSAFPTQDGGNSGAVTQLVITFQGDRLEPATAEDPANYRVTWLGPNGVPGGGDDVVLPLASVPRPVVYTPGANTEVSSGRTYPTSTRQTATLLFAAPLPAGNYQIELAPEIQSAPFNAAEDSLLVPGVGFVVFHGQPVVQIQNGGVRAGATVLVNNLVTPSQGTLDFSAYTGGTGYLTQFHNDLGALLNQLQTQFGDDPEVSAQITAQILARFGPAAITNSQVNFLIFWLDPVSLDVADARGERTTYNLQQNTVSNQRAGTFIEVGGNIEVIVMAGISGLFNLNIADVQASARGGAVMVSNGVATARSLTDSIRSGERSFSFDVPAVPVVASASTTTSAGGGSITTASFSLVSSVVSLLSLLGGTLPGQANSTDAEGSADLQAVLTLALTNLVGGDLEVGGDISNTPGSPGAPLTWNQLARWLQQALEGEIPLEELRRELRQRVLEFLREFGMLLPPASNNGRPDENPVPPPVPLPEDEVSTHDPGTTTAGPQGFLNTLADDGLLAEREWLPEFAVRNPRSTSDQEWLEEEALASLPPTPRLDLVLAAGAVAAGLAHGCLYEPPARGGRDQEDQAGLGQLGGEGAPTAS